MTSLLEGPLAKTIGKALTPLFYAATLTHQTVTGGDGYDPTTTTADYACKGIVDEYSAFDIANSLAQFNDRKILVLATSLSVTPKPDDTITIRGVTYRVVNVSTDPALAVWVLQGRI